MNYWIGLSKDYRPWDKIFESDSIRESMEDNRRAPFNPIFFPFRGDGILAISCFICFGEAFVIYVKSEFWMGFRSLNSVSILAVADFSWFIKVSSKASVAT